MAFLPRRHSHPAAPAAGASSATLAVFLLAHAAVSVAGGATFALEGHPRLPKWLAPIMHSTWHMLSAVAMAMVTPFVHHADQAVVPRQKQLLLG